MAAAGCPVGASPASWSGHNQAGVGWSGKTTGSRRPYPKECAMPTTDTTPRSQPAVTMEGEQLGQLTVVAWRDPLVEGHPDAIPTCSDEALVWWTPSVGPTGMLMAHRFAAYAVDGPTTWTVADLAATFGMGGSSSRLVRTLARLERFGIIS